ncbi:MAG TPA: hypothetical protein PLW35_04900 [Verrucomicrobiota bacterium]|nr:hypothetical protein [Verrucomicrobiota bacterium]HOK77044.1 hypothetical protein [Verrucomicrobiota bacterium]
MGTRWKRIFRGGLIASIGFILSPLSWWNDLFVNVPLALGFAWLVSAIWPKAFTAAFVAGYWITNVVGLILLRRGATELASGSKPTFSRKEIVKDIAVALAYTAIILLLAKLKVLKPL